MALKFITIDASALPKGITVSGGDNSRMLSIEGGTVTMNGITFTRGSATGNGGALEILTNTAVILNDCTFIHNTATGLGGAIYCLSSDLNATGVRVSHNESGANGGGISGAGLMAESNTITLTSSTLSHNTAPNDGGGFYASGVGDVILEGCTVNDNEARNRGGGIYVTNATDLTMTNCTVSGNRAAVNSGGVLGGVNGTFDSCTIVGNVAGGVAGGLSVSASGMSTINNTIVAGNSATSSPDLNVFNLGTSLTVTGINFIGDNDGCEFNFPVGNPNGRGDLVGDSAAPLDPLLSPLALFGGPTETHHPLVGSPVIGAAGATTLSTDQRGLPRVGGGGMEIGAVEAGSTLTVTTAIDENDGLLGAGAGDSLRECLDAAAGDGEVIRFAPSLSGQTILLTLGEILVSGKTVFIEGSNLASPVALNANSASRHLSVVNGSAVALHSVDFVNGVISGVAAIGGSLRCAVADVSVINSRFTSNGAAGSNSSLAGALSVIGSAVPARARLADCTFVLNAASGATTNWGGAIYVASGSLHLQRCVFNSNFAFGGSGSNGFGGAIYGTDSELVAEDSEFRNQVVTTYTPEGGGAISMNGVLVMDRCTFANNSAVLGGGGTGTAKGGVVFSTAVSNTLHATNSTFSGNSATDSGGALSLLGATVLRHCTFTANESVNDNGGAVTSSTGKFTMGSCIVAGNTAGNLGPDLSLSALAVVPDEGGNLIGDNSNVSQFFPAGPLVGTAGSPLDPGLGTLDENGGPTRTHPLLAGSPARDAAGASPETLDQRGLARPVGAAPDSGAYEAGHVLGYPVWAAENIPAGLDATFTGNPEGDANGNGIEYACGLVPTLSDGAGVLSQELVDLGAGELFHPSGNVTATVDPIGKTITVIDAGVGAGPHHWRLEVELIP